MPGSNQVYKVDKQLADDIKADELTVGAWYNLDEGESGHVVVPARMAGATLYVYDVNQYLLLRDGLTGKAETFNDKEYSQYAKLATDLLSGSTAYAKLVTRVSEIDQQLKDGTLTPANAAAAKKAAYAAAADKAEKAFDKTGGADGVLDLYLKQGNRFNLSFSPDKQQQVSWVRTEEGVAPQRLDKSAIRQALADASEGHKAGDTVCSTFVGNAVPAFKGKTANEIEALIEQGKFDPRLGWSDPSPVMVPTKEETPARRNASPGGVAHTAVAEVIDLDPHRLVGARFDEARGKVVLQATDGQIEVSLPVTKDELAVGLVCVFGRQVSPTVSVVPSEDPGHRDSFEVQFTGPIFDTTFGRIMVEADRLLGNLMFGYLGWERDMVASALPLWAERWRATRLLQLKPFGSRVFMATEKVTFRAEGSVLAYTDSRLRFIHETTPPEWSWVADRESSALADYLERNQSMLRELFPVLDDFARLGSMLALLRWLHVNQLSFDWEWAKQYTPTKDPFPIFVPIADWTLLSGAPALDGWQAGTDQSAASWTVADGDLVGMPAGTGEATPALLYNTRVWPVNYEAEFLLKTDSVPLSFVCKYLPGKLYAEIALDSSEQFRLFRVTVKAEGAKDGENNIIIRRDGEPFWQGNLASLYKDADLTSEELQKSASFGFCVQPGGNARIGNVRFRSVPFGPAGVT